MAKVGRAELGVDGDHAFALLGVNIQEGEAEFVKIESTEPKWTTAYEDAATRAATQALRALEARLGRRLSYAIGPSHPRYV